MSPRSPSFLSAFRGMKQAKRAEYAQGRAEAQVQARYSAARPSKGKRNRLDIGGTADAHYQSGLDFWRMREDARAMDRDDWTLGQCVDRAVTNVIKSGMHPDPDTGDAGLNAELAERWSEWAEDPYQCDRAGRLNFVQMQELALRHALVDGDIFIAPNELEDGIVKLTLLEGERVRTPGGEMTGRIIHGVELDDFGAPTQYHITRPDPDRRSTPGFNTGIGAADFLEPRQALDIDGLPNVIHLYDPKRVTQTRGVTAFKSIFDVLSMLEDGAYAKLIQNQVSSCIALFIKRESDHRLGSRYDEAQNDGVSQTIEELTPGLILRGTTQEGIEAFNPSVVSSEWFDLMRFFLRVFGAQIGMPLTLVLLDTSNTTFHGYRGELQQARLGFERLQSWLTSRFLRPVWKWKVREWFPDRFARDRRSVCRHSWQTPGWPYVDPLNDVKADSMALQNGLTSPRRALAARGLDYDTVTRETVADRSMAIAEAIRASEAIATETGVRVPWREVLNLAPPPGLSISATQDAEFADEADEGPDPAPEPPAAEPAEEDADDAE